MQLPADDTWVQPHPGTFPQQEYSVVEDGAGGLAVFNRGLPEIAAREGADGATLFLTLLRSVGWLSRDDFPTRRHSNAGPTIPTPDAQCLGTHRFRYALLPFSGSRHAAGVRRVGQRWRAPVPVIQGVGDGSLAGDRGLLRVDAADAIVTALKRHEERDTLVVRLFNPRAEPVEARLVPGPTLRGATLLNLLEEATDVHPGIEDGMVVVSLPPHRIQTVELDLEAAET
jgi:mannosylglycerate hydrolase